MTLDIACAVQGAYVPHSAAMLHSMFGAGAGQPVRAHYMHAPNLNFRSRDRLKQLADRCGGEIVFWEIAEERVAGLPVQDYFTSAMWYRILLPELLTDVERVLYVDVDTIAMAPVAPLWDIDLSDALVGAVTNVFEQWRGTEHTDELGLRQEDYFNSGVLLLNLEQWRQEGTTAELRRVATERGATLRWPDQDALNLVLGQRRVALHPRWNVMNSIMLFTYARDVFGNEAAAEARRDPGIRHFEGPGANKPWERGAKVPDREAYRAHRRATPWRWPWASA